MILHLKAYKPDGQPEEFSFWVDTLDTAMGLLQTLTGRGARVTTAHITEQNGTHFEVPLELVDEYSVDSPVHQLRQEWERILSLPPNEGSETSVETKLLKQQWGAVRKNRAEQIQMTIRQLQNQLEMAQERLKEGPQKAQMIAHYRRLLTGYHTHLKRVGRFAAD